MIWRPYQNLFSFFVDNDDVVVVVFKPNHKTPWKCELCQPHLFRADLCVQQFLFCCCCRFCCIELSQNCSLTHAYNFYGRKCTMHITYCTLCLFVVVSFAVGVLSQLECLLLLLSCLCYGICICNERPCKSFHMHTILCCRCCWLRSTLWGIVFFSLNYALFSLTMNILWNFFYIKWTIN